MLVQRPCFFTDDDVWLISKGLQGKGGYEKVGTRQEKAPLLCRDVITYDEACISALLGISGPMVFINNGSRANQAIPQTPGQFQRTSINE